MPKIKEIVQVINDRLMTGPLKGRNFQRGQFYGLATSLVKDDGAVVPCMVDSFVPIDVTVNDQYPFQIYHKNATASYPQVPASDFGRLNVSSYAMTAVVYFDAEVFGMTSQDMAYMIRSELSRAFTPAEIGSSGLNTVQLVANSANFNSQDVFKVEYPNYPYQLDGNERMFTVNYTVTVTAQMGCIACENC